MNFEYDPEKNSINLAKHGISFDTAKDLWEDPDLGFKVAKVQITQ